ncbi:probable elongation factor 1-delta isoform X1 [Drosophila teissieri]|uniref:probable elongation factor 1-delta isoform X1 n=1 Tax=Drosophila teissieri TaxID=7243 RepID=UPI001CBA3732|nr:probable elongation factor 1-delta isoform X1 [Drosophila teissieri]
MKVEALDKFWADKSRYALAEKQFYEGPQKVTDRSHYSPLVSEIAKAREHIQNSLEKIDGVTLDDGSKSALAQRLSQLEGENKDLKSQVSSLSQLLNAVVKRLDTVEAQLKLTNGVSKQPVAEAKKPEASDKDDDDDVDLFGSESEEEDGEAARIREERLAAYAAKKAKKVQIIAKSNIILDVKPWDDETDLKVMETEIRKITQDGLLWGASKFVPVAFGIQKLSISCVVEDDKVSIDWLTEEIEKLEDFVQSVDIAAFNKI